MKRKGRNIYTIRIDAVNQRHLFSSDSFQLCVSFAEKNTNDAAAVAEEQKKNLQNLFYKFEQLPTANDVILLFNILQIYSN